MFSNLSIVLLLVLMLVSCGCETHRESRSPVSYRPRTSPAPNVAPSNPAPARRAVVNAAPESRAGGSRSVVYRSERARNQSVAVTQQQSPTVSLSQIAAEGEGRPHAPAQGGAAAASARPANRGREDVGADAAKLKALYDAGFMTREEYLNAKSVK